MRKHLVMILMAFTVVPAAAQGPLAKPHLMGSWQNSHNSPRCEYFPTSIRIDSATDAGAHVESTESNGLTRVWTDQQTQVVGPRTDPDSIFFKFDSFQYADEQLRFVQVGPDGPDICIFTKLEAGGKPQP